MSEKLTWSYWYEMLSFSDMNMVYYYVEQCEINNLDVRELREKIKNKEYERLPKNTKEKFLNNEKNKIIDYVKNPIIKKYNSNLEIISEKALQRLILEDIPSFLKELGDGFSFIDNEYKIKVGNNYNYIDLLLYNIKYKCYAVIELKITKLKKEHIGQIEVYMNYIDKNLKPINENKTIGIIICKEDDKYIIEYSSDERIISREFLVTI